MDFKALSLLSAALATIVFEAVTSAPNAARLIAVSDGAFALVIFKLAR
jgi:hypothetical protein